MNKILKTLITALVMASLPVANAAAQQAPQMSSDTPHAMVEQVAALELFHTGGIRGGDYGV